MTFLSGPDDFFYYMHTSLVHVYMKVPCRWNRLVLHVCGTYLLIVPYDLLKPRG